MKLIASKTLLLALASTALVASALGQREPARRTAPVSKVFIAEVRGDSRIVSGERVLPARQATTFDAPGAIFETRPDSHLAFVLSNGTGVFLDADTRIQIQRFEQERFRAGAATLEAEPSLSQTAVFLTRGFLGISTAQMASGSSMVYSTAHGLANVRGRHVAIETTEESTLVYLLDGDVTVATTGPDALSRLLLPGQFATIWPGPPPSIVISEIPAAKREILARKLGLATAARRTVSFETVPAGGFADDAGATGEIVPRPAVPAEVPSHLVVSPDRLPGTD